MPCMANAEKGPAFGELPHKEAIRRWNFLRRDRTAEGLRKGGFKALGWGLALLLGGALATPLVPAGAIGLMALNATAAAGKFLSILGGGAAAIGLATGVVNDHRAY